MTTVNGTLSNETSGTIEGGKISEAEFVNTYNPASVIYPVNGGITATKVLEGRPWADNDSYTFVIAPYNNAPLPTDENGNEISTITLNHATGKQDGNDIAVMNLGNIQFNEPGIYRYTIYEQEPENNQYLPGMSYSNAVFRLYVEVSDNGEGQLVANANVQQLYTDDDIPLFTYVDGNIVMNPGQEEQDEIKFVNTYNAQSVIRVPLAIKTLIDTTDNKTLSSGMFDFELIAKGYYVEDGDEFVESTDIPMPSVNGVIENVTTNEGTNVTFHPVEFTQADLLGHSKVTYVYVMKEIIPENPIPGMTYSTDEQEIKVEVYVDSTSESLVVNGIYPNNQTVAQFTNTYDPADASVVIKGNKLLNVENGSLSLQKDMFTFEIEAMNNAPLPENTQVKNNADGTFEFPAINFDKVGTYQYKVKELVPAGAVDNKLNGITYTNKEVIVTVKVTDNDLTNGTLEFEVLYDNKVSEKGAEFVNTYNVEFTDTPVSLSGKKVLTGTELKEGHFFFVITPHNGAPLSEKVAYIPNKSDGTFELLKNIKFTKPGTYQYEIVEALPNGANEDNDYTVDGMTYDAARYMFTVVVEDNQKGELKVVSKELVKFDNENPNGIIINDLSVQFENSYEVSPGSITLPLMHKVIAGNRNTELQENEFTFKLSVLGVYDLDRNKINDYEEYLDLPVTEVTNRADGTIVFDDIIINKEGYYQFKVEEVAGNVPGITYTTATIVKTYRAIDNGDGTMTITLLETIGEDTFTNEYNSEGTLEGKTNLAVNKIYKNNQNELLDWSNEVFEFILTGKDETTINAIKNGMIILPDNSGLQSKIEITQNSEDKYFGDIKFLKPGNYIFLIYEHAGENQSIDYDASAKTVYINAIDNGDGTMTVLKGRASDQLTFVNTYNPDDALLYGHDNLPVIKQFTGRENDKWLDSDEFVFELTYGDDNTKTAMEAGEIHLTNPKTDDPYTESLTINRSNKEYAHFSNIIFDKEGTYTFKVSEIIPDETLGITYDTNVKYVNVEVKNNGEGALVAEILSESDTLNFTNVYNAQPVELELPVNKVLVGRNWLNNEEFVFSVSYGDELTENAFNKGIITVGENTSIKNDGTYIADKKYAGLLPTVTINEPGTYVLDVKEVYGEDDNILYDGYTFEVIVEVIDNDEGQLVENWTITDKEEITFVNTHVPDPIDITLNGTKELIGRETPLAENEFIFNLIAKGDAPLPTEMTAKNDKDGNISFEPITFVEAGTYEYTIKEMLNHIPGVSYDTQNVDVKIVVTDNNGVLSAEVKYVKNGQTLDKAEFTNVYRPKVTDEIEISIYKEIIPSAGNMYEIEGEEFNFEFIPSANNPANDPIQSTLRGTNTIDGEVVFDVEDGFEWKYTHAGTYVYTLKELAESKAGMSYDTTVYTIKVEVVDNEELAQLETTVTINDVETSEVTFVNRYDPENISAVIQGQKELTGGHKQLETNEFTFVLEPLHDAPLPSVTEVQNNADGTFVFPSIEYTHAGVYEYTLKEVNEGKTGYTYDSAVYKVSVNVTDNDGVLASEVIYSKASVHTSIAKFTNKYVPESVNVTLTGTKRLTGRDGKVIEANEFTFKLLDENGNIALDNNGEDMITGVNGNGFTFNEMTFDKAGTYNYTMVEVKGTAKGMTYDESVFDVIVEVTDNAGKLEAAITYGKDGTVVENVEFINNYRPYPISVEIEANKTLTGRVLKDNEFKFILENTETHEKLEAYAAANGKVVFDEIEYNEAGTYNYTLSEEDNGLANVEYDNKVYNIIVSVTDNYEGDLVATVNIQNEDLVFTNIFTPTPINVTLNGEKQLNNRNLNDSEFEFVIEAVDNAPLPQDKEVLNDASGNFAFGPISYGEEGIYNYIIKETNNGIAGITYDDNHVNVQVEVTKDNEGQLSSTVTYRKQNEKVDNAIFVNAYGTTSSNEVSIQVNKEVIPTLGNEFILNGGEFKFELTPDTSNPTNDPIKSVVQGENDASGNVVFDFADGFEWTYSEEGTYVYTVKEINDGIKGMTYDSAINTIKVVVADDETKAQLQTTVTINDVNTNEMKFTNRYAPENGTALIEGLKVLTGNHKQLEANEFTFVLEAINDAPLPLQTEVKNNADGSFNFPTIEFNHIGEYKYKVREVNEGKRGYTYDLSVYDVTVIVNDNNGTLDTEVKYVKDVTEADKALFTNDYTPEVFTLDKETTIAIAGNKQLNGRDGKEVQDGEFTFKLLDEDGNIVLDDEGKELIVDVKDSSFVFEGITFAKADTYNYSIVEVKGDALGMTYDESVFDVTVTVTDKGGYLDGTIEYSKNGETADVVTFVNTYAPVVTTSAQFEAIKTLQGRKLKANEFKFILEDIETHEKLEAYADANGRVVFDEIEYNEVGIHTYKVYEEDTGLHNVAYDNTEYTIKVEVKDDLEGHLYTVITGYDKDLQFTNIFTPDPIDINFSGLKVLEGRELNAGEFKFVVEAKDDAPLPQVSEVTHDKAGNFAFTAIRFNEEGTYNYIIKEVDNGIAGITYDQKDVEVSVEVTRDEEGILHAEVSYVKDGETAREAEFKNTYETKSTAITLDINKVVETKDSIDYVVNGNEFEFKFIPSQNNENDPVNGTLVGYNNPNGKVVFEELDNSTITFDATGTYEYTLVETSGTLPGMSYDDTVYTVKVVVTDDETNAQLNAEVTINDAKTNKAEFINKYDAKKVSTTISGIKELISEHKNLEEDQFTFVLSGVEDSPLPQETKVTNDASGYFAFDLIEFDKPGNYAYLIFEENTGERGYTYDERTYYVYIEVTHNQETGELVLEKSIELDGIETEEIKFVNTYEPETFTLDKDTTIAIEGYKELIGRDALAIQDNEFKFELLDLDGNVVLDDDGNELIAGVKDDKFVFENITYTHAGTYRYSIVEQQGTSLGVTYDRSVFDVVVEVTDLGGYLDGTVKYYQNDLEVESVKFVNSYKAVVDANIRIDAKKVLTGRKLKANEFKFVLENTETKEKLYAYADEYGIVCFDKMTYSEVGTYTYNVYEEKGILDNITYDETIYEITVTVKDDLNGNLSAEVTGNENDLVFTNTYIPDSITVDLTIHKVLTGDEKGVNTLDKFEFEILDKDLNKTYSVEGTKEGISNYVFTYGQEAIGKTFDYVVREVNTLVEGVTYDTKEYEVSVTILQNEDGTLYSKVVIDDQEVEQLAVEFNNHYTPPVITNDDSHFMLWAAMMLLSSIMIKVLRKKEQF